VTDEQGNAISDAEVELTYENGKTEKIKVSNDDGKYAAVIKSKENSDVVITVKKENVAYSSTYISKGEIKKAAESKSIKLSPKNLTSKELIMGEEYEIADIVYQTNSAALPSTSKFVLLQFSNYLKANPNISVEIGGHTDDVGDDYLNLELSENRARGVQSYLILCGVNASRLTSRGYGETMPKADNDTEANRAINRRTVFKIAKL
jgi:outer membrane protein OmpA-like peptidoglycan-associated protein